MSKISEGNAATPAKRLASGFTLVELLVVLTILGFLAAVLFPVFVHLRERGRRTACLSNERQIGLAMLQYVADNDEQWHNWDWKKVSDTGWAHDAAYAYLGTPAVFWCPDDPTPVLVRASAAFPDSKPATPNSYGLNSDLDTHSYADLAMPTRTVMLFEVRNCQEAFTDKHSYGTGSMAGDGAHPLNCSPEGCNKIDAQYDTGNIGGRAVNSDVMRTGRHEEGANYVACDGHGLWLKPEWVSGGKNQPHGGSRCDQDDGHPGCGGPDTAAGIADHRYILTFSIR
jgi:prepilin-type N-terminal cleavage/methylation domain-containing protein/prepilin-type processing-associated H-X9-DG protein